MAGELLPQAFVLAFAPPMIGNPESPPFFPFGFVLSHPVIKDRQIGIVKRNINPEFPFSALTRQERVIWSFKTYLIG